MDTKRDYTIDIIKGLGIMCVVAGHANAPITAYIYLFHVAIFFIASGYCFNSKNSDSFKSVIAFVIKKFKGLWLPYFVWNGIFVLLHNAFIKLNIYTDNEDIFNYVSGGHISTTVYMSAKEIIIQIIKNAFFIGGTQVGGALWFFSTLFELLIGYCVIDFLLKLFTKKTLLFQGIVSVVFLIAGYLFSVNGITFAGIERFLSYYCFIYIGVFIRTKNIYSISIPKYAHILILVICAAALFGLEQLGSISAVDNSYPNPEFLVVATVLGWQLLYEIALLIQKATILTHTFVVIGQNTVPVMIFHLLLFKLVSLIEVAVYNKPTFVIASFPYLYADGAWWLAYTVVGLSLSVFIGLLWKRIKKCIIRD